MLYIIYKITNLTNQKFYIGAHKTENINDDYFGSGVVIKKAIVKYGKTNFCKEILELLNSEEEMYEREKELVFLGEKSYNITKGGKGGFSHIDISGDNNPMRKYPEARKKISELVKNQRNDPEKKEFYDEISRKNLKKAIEKNIGKKRPDHAIFMSNISQNMWSENKEKMRDILSSTFEVNCPEGNIYITNRLEDFCKEKNLPYTTIWKITITSKKPTKGKAKGWFCKRI
jgi:hypothetical protein